MAELGLESDTITLRQIHRIEAPLGATGQMQDVGGGVDERRGVAVYLMNCGPQLLGSEQVSNVVGRNVSGADDENVALSYFLLSFWARLTASLPSTPCNHLATSIWK